MTRRPPSLLALLLPALGCGSPSPPEANVPPPPQHVARVHRARCGGCHVRVEPGERTRPELEAALSRHHKRVRLSDEDWGKMIDYLARPVPPAL